MVGLGTNLHCFRERSRAGWKKHELLERQLISGMGSTIDNVECRAGENKRRLDACKIGQVLIERDSLLDRCCLRYRDGYTEDGVSTKLPLVRCSVELDKEVVDVLLGSNLDARLDELWRDRVVNVSDGFKNTCSIFVRSGTPIRISDAKRTFADIAGFVAITKLDGLMDPGGST